MTVSKLYVTSGRPKLDRYPLWKHIFQFLPEDQRETALFAVLFVLPRGRIPHVIRYLDRATLEEFTSHLPLKWDYLLLFLDFLGTLRYSSFQIACDYLIATQGIRRRILMTCRKRIHERNRNRFLPEETLAQLEAYLSELLGNLLDRLETRLSSISYFNRFTSALTSLPQKEIERMFRQAFLIRNNQVHSVRYCPSIMFERKKKSKDLLIRDLCSHRKGREVLVNEHHDLILGML